MKFIHFTFFLIWVCSSLCATELLPWYGQALEIETRGAFQLQAYNTISSENHSVRCPASDLFFDLSAGSSFNDIAGELEAIATDSRYTRFGMDCIKLTGRYRWLNDIIADPVSLVTGFSVAQVFKPGLRNLSSFHHGGIEGELHLSVGRENSYMQFWTSRYWGVAGVGIADSGYPWVRGDVAWEHNFFESHKIRLFANSLWGLGYKSLPCCHGFHGYGRIRHQLVDLGIRYSRFLACNGITFNFEYAFRVFARNCPREVNIVYVSLNYPFGLG